MVEPRKKRNALSLGEKRKVIELLEQRGSQRKIAITMGVSKTQIQQIHCSSELIRKAIQETAIPMQSKLKTPRAHNPELDQSVYDWFCKMRNPHNRCKPLPVSSVQVRAKREAQLRGISRHQMVGLHAGDGVMVWGRVSAFMGRLLVSI